MARIVLDQRELIRLRDATRVLAAPLEYAGVDAWRGAVNRTLKSLLGAEKATFQFPGQGSGDLVSDDIEPVALAAYYRQLGVLRDPLGADPEEIFGRMLARRVCDRRTLYGEKLEGYYRSEYFNEYIRQIRAYDGLMAAVPLPGSRYPAVLYLHHDRPHGGTFGPKPLALLGLLHPAFEAGVRAQLALGAARDRLGALVDAVPHATLLFGPDGRLMHRNPAASGLLASDPGGSRVGAAARELARSVGGLERARASGGGLGPGESHASRTVRTSLGRYRLRGTLIGGAGALGRPMVVVVVGSEPLPDARTLGERFGLTARQAEVALLLARRLSNREVARALSISRHTARHHTEMVLLKLGLTSRREVRARIAGGDGAGGTAGNGGPPGHR